MSPDKVMHPPKAARKPVTSAPQVKKGFVEGPTAKGSNDNLNPYNRGKK